MCGGDAALYGITVTTCCHSRRLRSSKHVQVDDAVDADEDRQHIQGDHGRRGYEAHRATTIRSQLYSLRPRRSVHCAKLSANYRVFSTG